MKKKIYAYDRVEKKIREVKTEEEAMHIADKGCPEYIEECPKCGCIFGVN